MKIIEQVRLQSKCNLSLQLKDGYDIIFEVCEPNGGLLIKDVNLNLFKANNNFDGEPVNVYILGLEYSYEDENGTSMDQLLVLNNIEISKGNYDRAKVFLDKFKNTFNRLQPVIGYRLQIKQSIDIRKLNFNRKKIQFFIYNNETNLPEDVFECEFKIVDPRVAQLQESLDKLLRSDAITAVDF